MSVTFGIDVSHWDARPVDWTQADMSFLYIKVSEGVVKDGLFRAHWDGAKGRTLRGGYHFFRSFVDPVRAAQNTVDLLRGDNGELPFALDLEVADGRADTLDRAKQWVAEYERLTDQDVIIYSRVEFMKSIGAIQTTLFGLMWKHQWLNGRGFWLAEYPFDNMGDTMREVKVANIINGDLTLPMKSVDVFPPMKTYIWQWTSRAKPEMVKGYYVGSDGKKAVDYNFANDEWLNQFKLGGFPPQGEENMEVFVDTPVTGSIVPKANGTRVRHDASTYTQVRADYNAGVLVEIDLIRQYTESTIREHVWVGDLWGRVVQVNGVAIPQPAWMAIDYHNAPICEKHYVLTNPGDPPTEDIWVVDVKATRNGVVYEALGVSLAKKT